MKKMENQNKALSLAGVSFGKEEALAQILPSSLPSDKIICKTFYHYL